MVKQNLAGQEDLLMKNLLVEFKMMLDGTREEQEIEGHGIFGDGKEMFLQTQIIYFRM